MGMTLEQLSDISTCKQDVNSDWAIYAGDACDLIKGIPDKSIHFHIFSPPFSNLYIYSDSMADMGNTADMDEFFEHFDYLIPELYRVTVAGRNCAVHCKDLPLYFNRDGAAGLIDFPGILIRHFEKAGWTFHSRITIWKCPVTERERTNNNGLLHKTVLRDRAQCRQGMADYLLVFRKVPDGTLMSDEPLASKDGFAYYVGDCDPRSNDIHPSPFARKSNTRQKQSIRLWQRYAEPVWWDINQTRVLNYKHVKSDREDKHICPLQLDVIERSLQLWSDPGEVVLSPFAGIMSEGYCCMLQGRRFIGFELKESYWEHGLKNLRSAREIRKQKQRGLFDATEQDVLI